MRLRLRMSVRRGGCRPPSIDRRSILGLGCTGLGNPGLTTLRDGESLSVTMAAARVLVGFEGDRSRCSFKASTEGDLTCLFRLGLILACRRSSACFCELVIPSMANFTLRACSTVRCG